MEEKNQSVENQDEMEEGLEQKEQPQEQDDSMKAQQEAPDNKGEEESSLSEREQELLQQIDELKKQVEENYNRFLRAQADFDNYRRRTMKEKEEMAKYASMNVIESLLPVVDNFERAIEAGKEKSDNDALMEGVEMVFRQFMQILEKEDVKPIEATGKKFDPNYHQAVMQVDSDEHESGVVVEELQKGYMMKDRVIRPSMVKVSS